MDSDEEEFLGYVYFPNEMHTEPVHLKGIKAAQSYVALQAPIQHRVIICDSADRIVFEAIDGVVNFP